MGCCVSTLDLWELEVPAVNPSVTATPCQLPFAREPLRVVPADNTHDSFQQIVTAPPMPGIVTG